MSCTGPDISATAAAVPPKAGLHPLRLDRPIAYLACLLGLLPVLSGVLFRTYSYHCAPGWYEALRQIDFIFLIVELGVVFHARAAGLDIRALGRKLPRDVRIAALILFTTFWLGSAFMSEWPARSLLRVTFWPLHVLFALAVWHLASRAPGGVTRSDIRSLALWLGAGLVLYLPILIIHLVSAAHLAQQMEAQVIWTSAIPGYLSIRIFGFHLGAVLTLCIALLWRKSESGAFDAPLYCLLFLAALLLFWSGSRGPIFAAGIGLASCALLIGCKPGLRELLAILAMLALAAVASSLWIPDSSFGLFRVVTDTQTSSGYTAGRAEMWMQTWDAFLASPLIGHGEDSTMWLVNIGEMAHTQPHNLILQLLGNWGTLAAVPAFWLLARAGLTTIQIVRSAPWLFPLLALLAMLIVTAMVDGVIYHPRSAMLFMAVLAIILAHRRGSLEEGGPLVRS